MLFSSGWISSCNRNNKIIVTIQCLHSYVQKSIPDQLRWWDFCLPAYVFLRSAQQVRRPTEQLPNKYHICRKRFPAVWICSLHKTAREIPGKILSAVSWKIGCDTAPFIYANNEPKSALARDLGDCRDNKGKLAKRVFTCYRIREVRCLYWVKI